MNVTPQADRIAHAGLPPDAFMAQMTALARELEAQLSQWRACAELLAELAQHPRDGDEFIGDYVELRARAMGAFRKLKEASK